MKKIIFASALIFGAFAASAQHPQQQIKDTNRGKNAYQNGKLYGDVVDKKTAHPIGDLDKYMGSRPSITTTVAAHVVRVADHGKTFYIKDDKGRIIPVHFNIAGYSVPQNIVGKKVLVDGIISKQFTADDHQHYAGATPAKEQNVHKKTKPDEFSIAARGVEVF